MLPFTQSNRWLQVRCAGIENDAIVLERIRGREAVSEPFRFELDLLADNNCSLQSGDFLGRPLAAQWKSEDQPERWIHGVATAVEQDAPGRIATRFRILLEPRLALLRRTRRSRVFQGKSVREIVDAILPDLSVAWKLGEQYSKHDYCMQYEESDFHFVHRLLEEEGIYYHFEHSETNHQLVFSDVSKAVLLGAVSLEYRAVRSATDAPAIRSWTIRRELRSGRCSLHDHAFQLTGAEMTATAPVLGATGQPAPTGSGGTDSLELYDHRPLLAHRYDDVSTVGADQRDSLKDIFKDLNRMAGVFAEREATACDVVRGESDVASFSAGAGQRVAGTAGIEGDYFVLEVEHEASQPVLTESDLDSSERKYANRFCMQPAALAYRPPIRHPQPAIGPQSATVVGVTDSDPIFTDKYGRVKVQFHWDRTGKRDANSSCWLRVLQPLAGDNFGMLTLPRVGQEVIVDFLDGDPDCPFVAGSVYNSTHMPPFELPAEKHRMGLKSRTINGDPDEFSGLQIDDARDSELLSLHAKRDGVTAFRRDHVENVGRYSHANYGCSRIETIGGLPLLTNVPAESPRDHSGTDRPTILHWMAGGGGANPLATENGSDGSGAGGDGGKIFDVDWGKIASSEIKDTYGMKCTNLIGSNSRTILGASNTISFGPAQTHSFSLGGFAAHPKLENYVKKPPYSGARFLLGAAQGLLGGATSVIAGSKYELIYGAAVSGLCGPKVDWIMDGEKDPLASLVNTLALCDGVLSLGVLMLQSFSPVLQDKETIYTWGGMGASYAMGAVLTGFVQKGALLAEAETKLKEATEVASILKKCITADSNIHPCLQPLVAATQERIGSMRELVAAVGAENADIATVALPKSHKYQSNNSDYTISAYNLRLVASPQTTDLGVEKDSVVDVSAIGDKGCAFLRGGKSAMLQSPKTAVACIKEDVFIHAYSGSGRIKLLQGQSLGAQSTVDLTSDGVRIRSGFAAPSPAPTIDVMDDRIEMKTGPGPAPKIEILDGSICFSVGTTSLEIGANGITFLSPGGNLTINSRTVDITAAQEYELTAAILRENTVQREVAV